MTEADQLASRLRVSQSRYGGAVLSEADVTLVLAALAHICPDPDLAITNRSLRAKVIELRLALGEANGLLAEARAARPAELDPAGVERVARVMAGIDATAPCRPLTEWQLWRDRARAAVRAYLGDAAGGDS